MGTPFGRYELLKRIAAGGMGEVHLARQAGLEGFEKLIVVKVLLPHLVEDEEFITMFLDEARVSARLNHPNICQIYDLGEVEGAYFIAMEYIHGDDVVRIWKAARQANKPVPLELACRIAGDAAAGLDYAHKATDSNGAPLGLVHRDISPQNILVTFDGGVKVIDFGVAKAAGKASHTATGMLKGKYAYMSPEQANGEANIDRRSDVFALGIVLYEMVTSMRLFKRETEVSTLRAVTDCQIDPPSSLNPEIDPQLDGIIMKALAKDVNARFQDCQSLRLALEDWMVQQRKPGSAAHLSAYMQDLYAERLKKEREVGRPFTDEGSQPSKSRIRPGTSAVTNAEHRIRAANAAEQSMTQPAGANRTAVLVAGAVGGALLVGGGLFFALKPAEKPAPVVAPVQAAMLNLNTRPSGADVILDGVVVGQTPLMGHPLTAGKGAQLEISLKGYKTVKRTLSGAGVENMDVSLEPDAPPPPPKTEPVVAQVEEVELALESQPAGATVQLGEKTLGVTPLAYKVPKSEQGLALTFAMKGFKPQTKTVEPKESQQVKVTLFKAAAAKHKDDPLDIKTGR